MQIELIIGIARNCKIIEVFQMKTVPLKAALPLLLAVTLPGAALAADHREAPLIQTDSRADINDVYAFRNATGDALVVAMTVNPLASPEEAPTYTFDPNVAYDFLFDRNGNGKANRRIRVTFSDPTMGPQTFNVLLPGGESFDGMVTEPSVAALPNEAVINAGPNGELAFAGPRDDPFFFDVVGFQRFLGGIGAFDGTDGFAGKNVSAVVLEVPLTTVAGGSDSVQVWGTTSRRRVSVRLEGETEISFGRYQQIERMGNPAVNTALIPAELKDLYNVSTPETDAAVFAPSIVDSLTALGTDAENIGILASVAVPDTLKIDFSAEDGYPNGRRLEDDVVDTLFFFIFNQTSVPDGVDANDKAFLDHFPYLAAPHQPE
ncbi:MAG: hypothetical protein DHS20C11_23890 [Lysobacteraceae bacterium]|nr:MAG: hypothetical protein DHS20C11_23890 [Xanthomonadaceae bacterium]